MQETSVIFDDIGIDKAEQRRQNLMFLIYVLVIAASCFNFGFKQVNDPVKHWFALILLTTGVLQILNWLLYKVHGRLIPAKITLTLIALVGNIVMIPVGGVDGTAYIWLLAFPSATFLFQGLRVGMILNLVYFAAVILLQVLMGSGVLPAFYSTGQLSQAWSAMIVMFILGYAAEKGWSDSRQFVVRQRENMRVLLQNMPAGVMMFSKSGALMAANNSAEGLLGKSIDSSLSLYAMPEVFGMTKENGEPFPIEDLPPASAIASGVVSGRSDIFVNDGEGARRVLRVVGAPVRDHAKEPVSVIAVIEDATKEHEIDRMKSEFVSLASHQLKTPLTGISWGMETLLSDAVNLTRDQRSIIENVEDIVGRLSSLVADLLNVSRIETGHKFNLVKKTTDVSAIVASILKEMTLLAEKRKIVLLDRMSTSLMLEVDAEKIKEALVNLIGNAIKYSKDGGRVEVGATKTQKDIILYVQDDGVGIPKHQKDRIFEKFFRAENVTEQVEGTGLGLYITRAIVEKHGGRVWFSTEEDKGTTFYVAFPLVSATEEKTAH